MMNNNNNNSTKKYFAIALAIFVIIVIGSAILSAVSALLGSFHFFGFKNFFYGGSNNSTIHEVISDYSNSFSNVERIKIDVAVANVTVVYSNNDNDVSIDAANTTSKFSVKQNNGSLAIVENSSSKYFTDNKHTKITITVPQSTVIDFNIDCGVGSFNAEQLICNDLEISNGVGDVNIGKLTAYNAELDNGVGNLYIGNAVISKTDIDCGVGNVEINYDMNLSDFRIDADSGISSVKINGDRLDKKVHSNPDGNSKITIDSGIGSIDLSFLD